ncbi:MAG TPA: hypothetical protein VKZ53_28845 [Candidatus Angelobacter sp.]|nr:hypothetical protein [Candidatus Angelobacter sp.]
MGIPAVAVATTEFITPARVQASALGRPGFEGIFVQHPIQDQTPEQISQRADAVVAEIVRRLTHR